MHIEIDANQSIMNIFKIEKLDFLRHFCSFKNKNVVNRIFNSLNTWTKSLLCLSFLQKY